MASVHSDAVNFLLDDGLLLSLVACPGQMTALSILLPDLVRRPPPVGAIMERRPGELQVAGTRILLRGGRVWPGRLRRRDLCGREPPGGNARGLLAGKASLLARALAARGKPGGFLGLVGPGTARGPRDGCDCPERGNPFLPFRARAAAVLRRVEVVGDPPLLRGLDALVGLGPGFTPSGDDFLAGALLAQKVLSLQGVQALRIDAVGILAHLHRSNPGGRTLLWLALRGSFPAYLLGAVRGLARAATPEAMSKVVEETAAHGETSGTDALVGLLWYLQRQPAGLTSGNLV